MVRRAVIIWLVLALRAAGVTPTNEHLAWRSLLLDIRDRCDATQTGTNTWAVPLLAATQTFRIVTGLDPVSTNCWTNSAGAGCVTNYAMVSVPLPATNMVSAGPTNVPAIPATNLQAAYTSSWPSANVIWQADEAIRALISSGDWVDWAAVTSAGGAEAWMASYTSTNWYWVDTDLDEVGDEWWPFPQHPLTLPVLTLSNAWARAGLEPLLLELSVTTSAVTRLIYGWETGALNTYATTGTITTVVTNRALDYRFTRAPTAMAFRVEVAQARILPVTTAAVVVATPAGLVTSVVYTTKLVQVRSEPVHQLAAGWSVPPREWATFGGFAEFAAGSAETNLPAISITGFVRQFNGHRLDGGACATNAETMGWPLATTTMALAYGYYAADVGSSWSRVETSGAPHSLIGSSVSIVFTGRFTTIGDWHLGDVDFRSPLTHEAWSQRVAVLKQLNVTKLSAGSPQRPVWTWASNSFYSSSYATSYNRTASYGMTNYPTCSLTLNATTTNGTPIPFDPCGVGGLDDLPDLVTLGSGRFPAPPMWSGIRSRWCERLHEESDELYSIDYAGPPGGTCDPNESREVIEDDEGQYGVSVEGGFDGWPLNIGVEVTNVSPRLSCTAWLVAGLGRTWSGNRDRIMEWFDGLYSPYSAGSYGARPEFNPEPSYPATARVTHVHYLADTNANGQVGFPSEIRTNEIVVSEPGVPAGSNRLAVASVYAKATGETWFVFSSPTGWPSAIPPVSFVDDYTWDLDVSGEVGVTTNSFGDVITRTASGYSEMTYRREMDAAWLLGHDEGNARDVVGEAVLLFWSFQDLCTAYE